MGQHVKTIIVIGNGMVGHRFLDLMIRKGANQKYRLVTFCEEQHLAYDRVHLSDYFSGKSAEDLSLVKVAFYDRNGIEVRIGDRVVDIDRQQRVVVSAQGAVLSYDRLVLATGSYPFVPPIPGNDALGTFVYRTLDDLDAIRAYAAETKAGVVVGGGLLGLECANALKNLGLETRIVEFAPRLMPVQLDDLGSSILRRKIERLGVAVHTSKTTTEILGEASRVTGLRFADGGELPTDLIVFSAGIRPRDELARECDLSIGERGGIIIDDHCRTSDPDIFAIGECALYKNRIYGLVAPGYRMAEAAADALCGMEGNGFIGADMSTKLKLIGVDVASFGDAFATGPDVKEVSLLDALGGTYKKIVVSEDGQRLLGGILVGDASSYGMLHQMMESGTKLSARAEDLILPPRGNGSAAVLPGVEALSDATRVCTCENVSKGSICSAIREGHLTSVGEVKACTKAGTGCGGCVPLMTDILNSELKKAGVKVDKNLCEHFPHTRQELYHLVRVKQIKTFDELIFAYGQGLGCEICKPAVASILASAWNEYILDPQHVPLQDTNDHFLANIQRDGTYSVVPRVPGGEITPDKLITLGQIAKDFGLYLKITGGQRIDMFGARVDQLPVIWKRLVEAGFESGHAYGKALRTVKSCVGTTWCRYGQQDSVSLAINLEERYKGLRAPHKIKAAVSGCTRECAEAQGKDFGLIATEKGYNLYLCGNGGMKPQHGVLFAEDLDEQTVVKYLDRFLMFYIRTADRLQRTATWLNKLEGGIDYLRQVIIEDSLGICEELEREMVHHVGTYQCEWKTTIEDEEKLKRFRQFVNCKESDPSLVYVEQRGQRRPAFPEEKAKLLSKLVK